MQEIANSLRQRLGGKPEPQEHPDADVLTAYGEQLLPASERSKVVLHLAQCSYCREVVSLSLPESAPVEDAAPAFAGSRFWVPALRWGAAVAALAIAATLVVEKPWNQRTLRQSQPAEVSSKSQSPQVSPAAPAGLAASPSSEPRTNAFAGAALDNAVNPDSRISRRTPERESAPPRIDNLASASAQAVPLPPVAARVARPAAAAPPPPAPLVASAEAIYKDSGRDYVNPNVLNGNLMAADAANLPSAPAARDTNGQVLGGRPASFPPVALSEVPSRSFAANIVPPTTAPAPATTGSDVTTLKSSKGGFRIPSRVGETVGAAVRGLTKGSGAGQAAGVSGFSLARRPSLKLGDNENQEEADNAPKLFWRISPEGILMTSADSTRWHEAYPQNSDLHLKVLLTHSDQVWAGGNNGTLIHSWNAGVNWETMNVPDSGDITSISIDDGWQVKTSDGQTFVSQDHGKTWAPVQVKSGDRP